MARRKLTPQQVRTRKNISRTEDLINQGCTKTADIANILGVSKPTARKYIDKVLEGYAKSSEDTMKVRQTRAVRRYEQLAFAAIQAFARSQENEEEITTAIKEVVCPNCNGLGEDAECDVCDRTGKIKTEIQSRRVRGKAGDSSFLNVARLCFSDIAKIEGTIQKNGPINIGIMGNDAIDKFKSLSDEQILKLRKMHQQVLNAGKDPKDYDTGEKLVDLRKNGASPKTDSAGPEDSF